MDASYDELLAQTSRRTTVLTMEPYLLKTESQRRDWRTLPTTIEQRLILGDKRIGMLAEELSDYLYERSTGHIGSLMDLIRRGCVRAIRTGRRRSTGSCWTPSRSTAPLRRHERNSPRHSAPESSPPSSKRREP